MTVAPDNPTTRKLIEIWQDVLGIDSVEAQQNYFDLGGDSSTAVQMFARIAREFDVKLPLVTLYEAPTIEELERILTSEIGAPVPSPATADLPSSRWSSLVTIQPSGSRPPLFCFHGAGGNVLAYRKLAQHLGPDQPFYGLQSQGLDGVSSPLTTIEEMAALYIAQLRTVQPRGPYYLAGYCMGGTIAYEVAQQLHRAGESVALLALLDTMNWHKIPLTIWNKSSHAYQRLAFHGGNFLNLPIRGKTAFVREKAGEFRKRIPVWLGFLLANFEKRSSVSGTWGSRLLGKIWKGNDQACWNYVAKPYPGSLTDFRPQKQYRVFSKPGLKWENLAQGGEHVVVLPVYPAGMLVEPFVQQLADALRVAIDGALSARRV